MNNEEVQEIFESKDEDIEERAKLNISNATTAFSKEIREVNPIERFNRLKIEIDQIEKDLNYAKNNKTKFSRKSNNLDNAFNEINYCKNAVSFISSSENFNYLSKIKQKVKEAPKKISFLSQSMYEKLNEHIINKIMIINKLKCDKPELLNNVNIELLITPDSSKVKLNTKFFELRNKINKIKTTIGEWDSKKNKSNLGDAVKVLRNIFKLLDSDYQNDLNNKLISLSQRLDNLDEKHEEFYHHGLNKQKIDDLTKSLSTTKEIEKLIYSTVEKLELMKNSHEESAFIFVKLKDMVEQQEKISENISENEEILSKLSENIKENIKMMKSNLEMIKTKFEKIKEKLKL